MHPAPIPADRVWPGAERRVLAAPDGDLTNPDIAPCEVVVDPSVGGQTRVNVRLALDDGDLERLATGGEVWLSMLGGLLPFSVVVLDEGGRP